MKQKISRLNLILHWIWRISFAVLICTLQISAQQGQQLQDEFIVGAFIQSMHPPYMWHTQRTNYEQILECGFNSVFQIAIKDLGFPQTPNLESLSQFGYVYAANDSGTGGTGSYAYFNAKRDENIDWISYFTQAKYTKWEAEGSPVFIENDGEDVKVKHDENFGYEYTEGNISGWTSGPVNPINEGKFLMKGPDYWQWPRYTYTNPGWNNNPITYKAVFRMKIDLPSEVPLPVCQIMITNTDKYGVETYLHLPGQPEVVTLTTEDLSTEYQYFEKEYNYIGYFDLPQGDPSYPSLPASVTQPFEEIEYSPGYNAGSKVQLKVKWLGNRELFVDYIEVYDERIWEGYIKNNYPLLLNRILTYDNNFKTANINFYNKLKYYGTIDEPHVIDCYEPLRKVQFILDSLNINADLLVHWYPGWDHKRDGDNTWPVYNQLAQPKKIMFWYSPFVEHNEDCEPKPRDFTLYWLQRNLQQAHLQLPDFFVTLQTWGTKNQDGHCLTYMHPTPEEVGAETMLSLAHGVAGIFYEMYYSFYSYWYPPFYNLTEGLVELPEGDPPIFPPNTLWNKVQELASRLDGTLGNALLTLDYNATNEQDGYLWLLRHPSDHMTELETQATVTERYLTLSEITGETPPPPLDFHAGFFEKLYQPDNHHFFLTNLITTGNRYVNVRVISDCSVFLNTRFRNIEPEANFDTTFTCEFSTVMLFPPGEGRLYQVAPVVKYGGKLIYNETISGTTTLLDEMVIQNGATLTVNSTYNVDRDIRIKAGGSIVTTNGGTLKFYEGSKLIVEGPATLSGTSQHRLIIDFISPDDSNGIVVNQGGSLNISYCSVGNATNGINANLNTSGLYIYNTDFSGCSNSSINITGQTADGAETPPPPEIKYCTVTGTLENWGISVFNLSEIIIQENDIQNTNVAIFLSQVPHAHVINNTIANNTYTSVLQGILLTSVGGDVRGNTISRHSEGIRIANSPSLNIGGNEIHDCKYHGIFIDVGSNPYMIGRLIYDITFHGWYAISGYNNIYDNGGYYEPLGPAYNDGSEIYINRANVQMRKGCNSVVDNRIVVEDPRPGDLAYTQYLMNGRLSQAGVLNIENNFWDVHPVYPLSTRFGSLIVDYIPYKTEACEIPVEGGMLITRTSTGQAVDTLYAISEETGEIAEIEELYGTANKLFITGEIESSESYYDQLISIDTTLIEKVEAYTKKYEIGKLLVRDQEYFDGLRTTYTSLASSTDDSLMMKIFNQLSTLCLVGQQEYTPAINEFDEIIQQNPNTEEAVFAEIDAVTTGMLIEGSDSTLQKGRLGKYLIKPGSNHFSKLNGILKKNFGTNKEETEEEILPTEYTLYQNYPNPFNPVTTIKYDLPFASDVSLIIYDILGRKVKELVNTKQPAGRYEVQFDASNLASGVYIYQLIADEFISSKKMILLK